MSAYGAVKAVGTSDLVVAVASCYQGQTLDGVENGWVALAGDDRVQNATFVDFRSTKKFQDPVKGSVLLYRNIAQALEKVKEKRGVDVPVLCLGGDHTVSIGSIMASKRQHNNTRLIWIDAHPDINTPNGTLTGNCHGMPVAHVMGFVEGFKTDVPVRPHEIVYIGLRSIDEDEAVRLEEIERQGALLFRAEAVKTRGIEVVLQEIDMHWGGDDGQRFDFPIHMSLDIDSVDPEFTPATGTPVPGGLMPSDVEAVMRWANKRAADGLTHLDIVELNPYLASVQEAATTVNTTQHMLSTWVSTHAVLGKQAAKGWSS